MTIEQVQLTESRWLDFFEHYKGLPGQKRGLLLLRKHIIEADPALLVEGAEWIEETRKNPPALATAAQQPAQELVTIASPFTARLTPNIRLGEFALGRPERRFHFQHQIDTARELAQFLERVRAAFGKPVGITSGYRPPAINRSVGGASGSEHLFDAPGVGAVDVIVPGEPIINVQRWIDREWPFSVGYGAPKGFVHVGIRRGRPRVRWDY